MKTHKKKIIMLVIALICCLCISSAYAVTQSEKDQLTELLTENKESLGDLNQFKQVIDKAYNDLNSATTVDDTLKETLKADVKSLENVSGMSSFVLTVLKAELNSQIDKLTNDNLNDLKEEMDVIKEWTDSQVPSDGNQNNSGDNGNNSSTGDNNSNNNSNSSNNSSTPVQSPSGSSSNSLNSNKLTTSSNAQSTSTGSSKTTTSNQSVTTTNKNNSTTQVKENLPETGKTRIIVGAIILLAISSIVSLIKYKKCGDMKE